MRGPGSGWGRKKRDEGSVDCGVRTGRPSDRQTVPSWRNGFLGSDIVVADWTESGGEGREGETREGGGEEGRGF